MLSSGDLRIGMRLLVLLAVQLLFVGPAWAETVEVDLPSLTGEWSVGDLRSVDIEELGTLVETIDSASLRFSGVIDEPLNCAPEPCKGQRAVGSFTAWFEAPIASLKLDAGDLQHSEARTFETLYGDFDFLLDGEELVVQFFSINDFPPPNEPEPSAVVESAVLIVVPEPGGVLSCVCALVSVFALRRFAPDELA